MARKTIASCYLEDLAPGEDDFRRTAVKAILRGMGARTYLIDLAWVPEHVCSNGRWKTIVRMVAARGVTVDPGRLFCDIVTLSGRTSRHQVTGKYLRVFNKGKELPLRNRKWLIGSELQCETASAR